MFSRRLSTAGSSTLLVRPVPGMLGIGESPDVGRSRISFFMTFPKRDRNNNPARFSLFSLAAKFDSKLRRINGFDRFSMRLNGDNATLVSG